MTDNSAIHKKLEDYFKKLGPITQIGNGAIPNGIFELNTSRSSVYCKSVLDGSAFDKSGVAPPNTPRLYYQLSKQALKWLFLIVLAKLEYREKSRHRELLNDCQRAFVGFAVERDSQLVAKDFDGVRETLPEKNAAALSLALKHPTVDFIRYLRADEYILPVIAYVKMKHVLAAFSGQLALLRAIQKTAAVRSSRVEQQCSEDICSGHAISSHILGVAIGELLANTRALEEVYFPTERHDWEQIALHIIAHKKISYCIQNCTFSPYDLNMYVVGNFAPEYRKAQPSKLSVISHQWKNVFQTQLRYRCPLDQLKQDRITGRPIPVAFNPNVCRILYLSSINKGKLLLDLEALKPLALEMEIEVRVHPSISAGPLEQGFKLSNTIEGEFSWCVFADTSMVFQLQYPHEQLVFISHDTLLTQDPTEWFTDFGSRSVHQRNILSLGRGGDTVDTQP